MTTLVANFHFLRPLWLVLLLAIPLFWILRRRVRADAGAWRAAVDPALLPYLIERVESGAGRTGVALAIALWTLATFALAGPAWEREPMPLYRNQAARVLAVELSPTMMAQDAKPSRLERARYKLVDILERSRDYQTALIGYAGDAFVAAPLTDDVGTVRNLIDALDPSTMPVGGNHAARAIRKAGDLIRQAGLHRGELIVLADGADSDAIAAARTADAQGLTVSVLGIGTSAGAPVPLAQGDFLKDDSGHVIIAHLDEASLRALAEAGGGRYARLTAGSGDIDALLSDRAETAERSDASANPDELAQSTRWRDRGPWLLLIVLPLAALAFRRGWLMAIAFVFLMPPAPVRAASFEDLWLRSDQQAAAALAGGDAKTAGQVARTPDWRAAAAYRSGNYESAAKDYADVSSADGAYNQGNALAKLGRYEDAIAAYDRALKTAPDMDDAKANKAAVEAWLKRQQQNQDGSKNQQSSSSGSKDQKSSQGSSETPQDQKSDGSSDSSAEDKPEDEGSQPKEGKPSDKDQDKNGSDGSEDEQNSRQSASGGEDDKADAKAKPEAQKPSDEQKDALSKAIDRSLASAAPKKGDQKDAKAAAAGEDDASREKRQALEHLLQRVPDDPGGLLRRKFLLEYQRRQQQGDDGE